MAVRLVTPLVSNLNRLIKADFAPSDQHSTSYTYDLNGNILTLDRRGFIYGSYGHIDRLKYGYTGNQLKFVNNDVLYYLPPDSYKDNGSKTQNAEFFYDYNGNMRKDDNKTMESLYNLLNLPGQTTRKDENMTRRLYYQYSARGIKTREIYVQNGVTLTTRYYAGPFVFINSTAEPAWVNMSYGRFVKNGSNWTKEIHLKDHLGNTRMAMLHNGSSYTIAQENFYYPFGGRISTLSSDPISLGNNKNRYMYNGKEFNDHMGLNWYDYGARFYDAQIGRFHSVDLLAEVYSFQSPFAYAANNPIYYIDYMGMGPKEWWEKFKGWVNTQVLNKTYSGNHDLVKPEKETRTVVFAEEDYVTPSLNLDWAAYFRGEQLREPDWGGEINYYSSFDYSNRKNVRGQGVLFNYQEQGRQVWQERSLFKRQRILLSADDRFQVRVDAAVRRFLGLNMGNRMHISFHGRNPDRPIPTAAEIQYHRDTGLAPVYHWPRTYYQMILRLHGTRAYFEELQRAGIIESFQ